MFCWLRLTTFMLNPLWLKRSLRLFHICREFYTFFLLCSGGRGRLQAKYSEGSEQGETRVRGQRGQRGQSLTSVPQIRQKSRQVWEGSAGTRSELPRDVRLLPAESAANKEHRTCLNATRSLPPHLSQRHTHASAGSLRTVIKSPVFPHFHNIPCILAYGETHRQAGETGSLEESADQCRRAGVLRDLEGQQSGGKRNGAQVRWDNRTWLSGRTHVGRMSQQHQRRGNLTPNACCFSLERHWFTHLMFL